jgi:hypothetical protein
MRQNSPLCTVPVEILEKLALEVALTDICGSTATLTPLLCSCKYINSVLSFGSSNALYARILKSKFDVCAPRRRFGDHIMENEILAHQLRKYCITLRRIRHGDIFSPYVLEVFWTAFLMLLDNDGKNMCQLACVGLDDFVDRFVRTRVYESRWQNNGWPAENPANALALWLLWMMTTQGLYLLCRFVLVAHRLSQKNYGLSPTRDDNKSLILFSLMSFCHSVYVSTSLFH